MGVDGTSAAETGTSRPSTDKLVCRIGVIQMNAAEVTRAIEAEIAGNWALSNDHNVDLRTCLVRPTLCKLQDPWSDDAGGTVVLWLVLEEDPETKSGYMIVFDDREGDFGLATHGTDGDVFLGFYGSFLETLEGM